MKAASLLVIFLMFALSVMGFDRVSAAEEPSAKKEAAEASAKDKDEKAKEDDEDEEKEAPPDRYEVPEGGVDELLKFVEGIQSYRPLTMADRIDYMRKSPKALQTAAEKILELEKDESAAAYKTAKLVMLGQRVRQMRVADMDEKKEILSELTQALKDKQSTGLTSRDLSLAMTAATGLEYGGQPELAADAYTDFAEIFSASDEENIANSGKKMEGSARRLRLVGNPMELQGTLVGGGELDWDSYRGKVVLVDFWATWCGPCMAELPNVRKNYALYHDRGFDVVGISLDQTRDALQGFLDKSPLPWSTLFEDSSKGWTHPMATYYGINGIPTVILVDKAGKVISLRARGEELSKLLEQELGPVDEDKRREVEAEFAKEKEEKDSETPSKRAAAMLEKLRASKAKAAASKKRDANREGDELAILSTDPPLPHEFKVGERLTVEFDYTLKSADNCRIYVRPFLDGRRAHGYAAHGSPAHERGSAKGTAWFALLKPGQIDEIRIQMVIDEEDPEVASKELFIDADAEWTAGAKKK